MSDVTRILDALAGGDARAAQDLLPLVYAELRQLAARKLASEKPGQTLDATGLVHEAYLRLVGPADDAKRWENRGHFFAAAAEAMRRILVEAARRRDSGKRGGGRQRVSLDDLMTRSPDDLDNVLDVDQALDDLARADPQAAELVKLRFFSGLTGDEAAAVMGISARAADFLWSYARAWLFERLSAE
ncbi:MAG TPA: ECF-type sigma factor [Gemmataceae bacterium]|jgi:RNA polymerase sigma factor (TIGR02999 family)|nr:ECF-type sigma factor [Gemmataceae bacterium]